MRYKARLMGQCFSQKLGIDYEGIYATEMNASTFRSLISLVIKENLDIRISI